MFKVIKEFRDLKDNNYIYRINDIYPYDNKEVSSERIQELASKKNLIGKNLIKQLKKNELVELAEKLNLVVEDESKLEETIKQNIPQKYNIEQ